MNNNIDINSAEAKLNAEMFEQAIDNYKTLENKIIELSSKKKQKNKLLPFERLRALIDEDSYFLPLNSIAGHQVYDDDESSIGGGVITGIGIIKGIDCAVMINNYTVKGGTFSPSGLKKILRIQEVALKNKLPLVHLCESGGANLNYASEVFVAGGEAFANQARLSAAGIPQIVVVHGNATAGGAYQPGMSDYIILIKNQSKMFLAGPPLVKAAIGEDATEDELGGDRIHFKTTGTGEFLVENDEEAIQKARETVKNFKKIFHIELNEKIEKTKFSPEEILSLIPENKKKSYDVKLIWERIIDENSLEEFKSDFDQFTVCCFAEINQKRIGLIGNNGPITAEGANKSAQFIQLCDQQNIPLIFCHNTTGFMVGTHSEKSGLIKHGSKLIQAVTNARVPKVSIIFGGSYGAGNYAMCGKGMGPDFIFAWPNSNTAVMGGEQAGKVMRLVSEAKLKASNKAIDKEKLKQIENSISQKVTAESHVFFGSARLWDDGIIDPRDTRKILNLLLNIFNKREQIKLKPNTFGISRF